MNYWSNTINAALQSLFKVFLRIWFSLETRELPMLFKNAESGQSAYTDVYACHTFHIHCYLNALGLKENYQAYIIYTV